MGLLASFLASLCPRPVPGPGPRFVFRGPGADLQGPAMWSDDVGDGLDDVRLLGVDLSRTVPQ